MKEDGDPEAEAEIVTEIVAGVPDQEALTVPVVVPAPEAKIATGREVEGLGHEAKTDALIVRVQNIVAAAVARTRRVQQRRAAPNLRRMISRRLPR